MTFSRHNQHLAIHHGFRVADLDGERIPFEITAHKRYDQKRPVKRIKNGRRMTKGTANGAPEKKDQGRTNLFNTD